MCELPLFKHFIDPAAFAYTGLHDILVYVEETAHADLSEDVCGQYAGPSNTDEEVEIVCERTIVGQFVKILMTSFGSLVLCEIQIYADETFSSKLCCSGIKYSPVQKVLTLRDLKKVFSYVEHWSI